MTKPTGDGTEGRGAVAEDRAAALQPYGRALEDYHFHGRTDARLGVRTSLGDHERVPVALFFRGEADLLPWELHALELARGRVLDAGAGAGVHSLLLQERGSDVTAVDLVPEAVRVMRDRGVAEVRQGELLELETEPFDTVLLLMNGLGSSGSVPGLRRFLERIARLVAPGGQILADAAEPLLDPAPRDGEARAAGSSGWPPTETDYAGEAWLRFEYRGQVGPPARELYVDAGTLARQAQAAGWHLQVAFEDEEGLYLARLVRP